MNYLPREIVSEILLYFRNYKNELHRKFKLGPRDIDMHSLIMNKYNNIWSKQINKKNQDRIIENMVEYYNKLYEKYKFGEGEHLVLLNKMQEINLFVKEEHKNRDGKHYESYNRRESEHYTLYNKTYELKNILERILG